MKSKSHKRFDKAVLVNSLVILLLIFLWFSSDAQQKQVKDKRMAGYHFTAVMTGETMPSSAVLTYPHKTPDYQNYNFLVKLMPCIIMDGKTIYPSTFTNVKVEDFPGGVEANFRYGEIKITTRIMPLLYGRGSKTWKGAALFEVRTTPEREIRVLLGKGKTLNLYWEFTKSFMLKDSVISIDNFSRIDKQSLVFRSGKDDLHVLVRGSGPLITGTEGGPYRQVYVQLSKGLGYVLTAFSDNDADLADFRKLNFASEETRVNRYYSELNKSFLETPEPVMNQAFTSALYNLEYSWFEPFGWGECLHHWLALWHMQVGAAADLIGQTDRSKSCIVEHARHLLKSGAVPQFMPNGTTKRDFGGSNQYWVWQVRHYLHYTGDREFAAYIIPYVDTVITQTLNEYDRDGDFLASWGLQIGNQEDFLANPYNGSVPSMELYNMFMTRAELSTIIRDSVNAKTWYNKAALIRSKLCRELWMNDLGRFAYYKDPTGKIMPDGQYQTYLYPIIYDIVDVYDQYSGLRHLRDRLTGENGAVFLSNNFPWHATGIACTWGMQCGEAQQPWAAAGFSKSGLNNETWRPLKTMADWAQDINHRGSWPETGPEPTPAYFTPPAGLYLVAITEALFGIRVNALKGYIEISPSFPDHWPEATLNLPDFQVRYGRKLNNLSYILNSTRKMPLKINWHLPVARITRCMVNGREVNYTVNPGVNHIIVSFDAPASAKTTINIEYEVLSYSVNAPLSVATGDDLKVTVEGATIRRIIDRCNVLEHIGNIYVKSFSGKIHSRLLDPYLSFNQLGLLNFSRRTIFIDCLAPGDIPFIAAIDLNILPRFEVTSSGNFRQPGSQSYLQLKVRNNTNKLFKGDAIITLANRSFIVPVSLNPRSEYQVEVQLPTDLNDAAGDNTGVFQIPGEDPLEIHWTTITAKKPEFLTIPLPEKDLMADTLWNTIRVMPGFPHIFFTFTNYGWPKPMWALENIHKIEISQIPGLTFAIAGKRFIPVSHLSGKTSYKLDLNGKKYKKIYLLVIPFVDNHDMFSKVARLTAYSNREVVYTRTLYYPGDVDYWVPDKNPTSFASYREPRPDRFGLLPLLKPDVTDWEEGKPPTFPQSKWWSVSLPVVTESCLMNVIEINLNKPCELDSLEFESLGVMPAFGIVAAAGELSE